MKTFIKRAAAATAIAGAMVVPATAASAAPVFTGGLVNVTIVDLVSLEQTSVTVPISVAANICDVSVIVLARDLADGTADCTTETEQITVTQQQKRR